MSYWEDRSNRDMITIMDDAEELSKELSKIYSLASQELTERIGKILDRFETKFGLTEEEAISLIKDSYDIETLLRTLQNAPSEETKEILEKIESQAYGARIRRLEALQNQIDELMRELYLGNNKMTTALLERTIQYGYYRRIWGIERQLGFQISFSHVDQKMVKKILNHDWSGTNYSVRIWDNTNQLAKRVKRDVLIDYLTGKKQEDIAQQMAKDFSVSAFQTRRLIRTETAYVYEQANQEAYEQAGIEKYKILATLDTRTSKICQEQDGKVYKVSEKRPGINEPPFHPFCRTTTIAYIDDEVREDAKRRARNPVTGKNELVPASMNYKQWAKQNGINTD